MRSEKTVAERRMRRMQLRVAHLGALLRLKAVTGTGRRFKFPSDGNLTADGGKNEFFVTVRCGPGRRGSW